MRNRIVQLTPVRTGYYLLSMVTAVCLLLLAGCWIPENFVAHVKVQRDGGYTFTYDGSLAYAPVLPMAHDGSLTEKDERELRNMAEDLKQETGYRELRYTGKGRFKVFAEKKGLPGEGYHFMSESMKIVSIQPRSDGSLKISGMRPSEEVFKKLRSIGASMTGKLTVSVPWGMQVLDHNAQSEPVFFGLFGGYTWEIDEPDDDPYIIVMPEK